MNPNQANKDLKDLLATVRQQRLAILGLVVCVGLSLLIMFNMVGRERIVLTPPTIDKTFWVAKDKVSASYLEQMGAFMAYLTLDVVPQFDRLEEGNAAAVRGTRRVRRAADAPGP